MAETATASVHPEAQPPPSARLSVRGALGDVLPDVVGAGSRFAMAWPTAFACIACCLIITAGFVYASIAKRVEVDMSKFATAEELKSAIAGVKGDYDRISLKIEASAADSLAKITTLLHAERTERLATEKEARETLRSVETRVIDIATRAK